MFKELFKDFKTIKPDLRMKESTVSQHHHRSSKDFQRNKRNRLDI